LQAVLAQDAFHAADADGPPALNQLLRDHFRRGIGIEKPVPDHLADEFRCAAVVGFRSAFLALQRACTPLAIGGAELKIALLAQAELLRGPQRAHALALAFDEHHQFARDFVLRGHFQRAMRSDQGMLSDIELRHHGLLP
jgi:hypothetical protein